MIDRVLQAEADFPISGLKDCEGPLPKREHELNLHL